MYLITDDYGTHQRVWTKEDALDWLRYCGHRAVVTNLWGRVVASRIQEN